MRFVGNGVLTDYNRLPPVSYALPLGACGVAALRVKATAANIHSGMTFRAPSTPFHPLTARQPHNSSSVCRELTRLSSLFPYRC
jgi:hypothetical protein